MRMIIIHEFLRLKGQCFSENQDFQYKFYTINTKGYKIFGYI